ncbi:hypothetical protein DKX38_026376 [Salix brachista]|uniref:Bms1-type G domain-containing protein n=1 Tax=Salix brachista TaxID=2182728 RepID=A0A5N5J9C0_9ROSI|nr:hypothetical protein DKX38_026376 [Salix brachista]
MLFFAFLHPVVLWGYLIVFNKLIGAAISAARDAHVFHTMEIDLWARLKRHRWHRKVLKTKDPVIFSIGWRRYQTTPVYAIEDRNGRHRMLKYTPEHMHCLATFWGPKRFETKRFEVQISKSIISKRFEDPLLLYQVCPSFVPFSKKRRVQFVECPNDINGMIDAAKFADLALLLIDGSYGFEMETFEFLNILQVHGFPKIMGVLTHLDQFKDVKKLKKTKQRLKHRFWTEIYDGAKLFNLCGLIHGKYVKREIHNLARFISVMKFHPLSWRTSHPYVLADRFEDVTPPERVRFDNKCDRNITLYGYLRGCNLKKGTKVHIAGVGDYNLAGATALADPCPLPSAAKKKGLRDKEKLFYAPMSGIGDLVYDKDAVYININDHFVQYSNVDNKNESMAHKGKDQDVGESLVKSLQNTKYSIDEKLEKSFISLFSRNANISSEAQNDAKDNHESVDHSHNLEPNESGEESDAEDLDGSESTDEDEAAQKDALVNGGSDGSDEEYGAAAKQKVDPQDRMKEQVEFHGGRLRRKAMFGNDIDDKDLKARLKRHRWHRKVLKTKDPVIFSIGWRRYQTTPVYAIEDRNGRHRMLKYTPEHMHCLATFWGPLAPPNTGVIAVQNLANNQVIILDFLHKLSYEERNLILATEQLLVCYCKGQLYC